MLILMDDMLTQLPFSNLVKGAECNFHKKIAVFLKCIS